MTRQGIGIYDRWKMGQESRFDQLAGELSSEERRAILDRMREKLEDAVRPAEDSAIAAVGFDQDYEIAHVGFFRMLLFRIRSFLAGKPVAEFLEEWAISRLMIKVELSCPAMMNLRRGVLLEAFMRELERLRDAARFFHPMLENALDRQKPGFIAFLATFEMEESAAALERETDPVLYAEHNSEAREDEVKARVAASCDELLAAIPDEQRKAMYGDMKTLVGLASLCAVPFEHMIGCFERNPQDRQRTAPAVVLLPYLRNLADAVKPLQPPPSLALVEALMLFSMQEEIELPRDAAIEGPLAKAQESLAAISRFLRDIPLVDLVRCLAGDLKYDSSQPGGGEDWFALYRDFWRARTEARCAAFVSSRRRGEVLKEALDFLGLPLLPTLAHIALEPGEKDLPLRRRYCLSFLAGFAQAVHPLKMRRYLKILFVEGEFFRKDNRDEFTEAYGTLERLGQDIAELDAKLAPNADLGSSFHRAVTDTGPFPLRRQRIRTVQKTIDIEAEAVFIKAMQALRSMGSVIEGVLRRQSGSRYDTIANYTSIDGKANSVFIKGLEDCEADCKRALELLGLLADLDAKPASV